MSGKEKQSKWGWGVATLYLGFVSFILILVMYASIQDFQMVEDDYYKKDLAYQEQIDRMVRTNKLDKDVSVMYNTTTGNIDVLFPVDERKKISGVIKMFRPSNARYDFEVPIQIDSTGKQSIASGKMIRGYWLAKILWKIDSVEYYSQAPVMIN